MLHAAAAAVATASAAAAAAAAGPVPAAAALSLSLSLSFSLCWQGNHTVGFGGKVAFVEGGEEHRTHSGSKGGLASNNAGPLIDIALLSEAPVRRGAV